MVTLETVKTPVLVMTTAETAANKGREEAKNQDSLRLWVLHLGFGFSVVFE